MTQHAYRPAAGEAPATLQWGPKPGMFLSPELAAAFIYEVWRAAPTQFATYLKKAQTGLWADPPSLNGDGHHG